MNTIYNILQCSDVMSNSDSKSLSLTCKYLYIMKNNTVRSKYDSAIMSKEISNIFKIVCKGRKYSNHMRYKKRITNTITILLV